MNGQQYSFDFESIFQMCFSDIVAAICILNELSILSLLFLWLLLMLFLMLLPNVRGLLRDATCIRSQKIYSTLGEADKPFVIVSIATEWIQ